jgi:signal transduction protein with GAF and PtsI domain
MTAQTTPALPDLEAHVARSLVAGGDGRYEAAVRGIASSFGAVTATLHRADVGAEQLYLVAQLGLPPQIIAVTQQIPFGKGIAGLCAVQREPVSLCNLQTDDSGKARPTAKQTGVAGAIAVPVFAPDGALAGVLGVGKLEEHTYTPEELGVLAACAGQIGKALSA